MIRAAIKVGDDGPTEQQLDGLGREVKDVFRQADVLIVIRRMAGGDKVAVHANTSRGQLLLKDCDVENLQGPSFVKALVLYLRERDDSEYGRQLAIYAADKSD